MKLKYHYIILLLLLLLLVSLLINIALGSINIPFKYFFGNLWTDSPNESWKYIITNYRLPKAITAILVGVSLSISGLLMQTLFRNPLAGPFVLGITSGASLGVALVLLGAGIFGGYIATLLASSYSLVIAAAFGSFLVLLCVLMIAVRVKDTMSLLIIGLMFGSITAAIVSVLSYFGNANQLQQYIFWGFGSLGNLSWNELLVFFIIIVLCFGVLLFNLKQLDTLLLGENYSKTLGVKIKTLRYTIIIITSLLAGTATALVGPIAFIGLAIPHIARQITPANNHKKLCLTIILLGAIVMLIADIIAQIPFLQQTLPISAITTLFGAPIVIWLLVKQKHIIF